MSAVLALPQSSRPARGRRFTPARVGLYVFLASAATFFAVPLYVMLVTSFKTMDEIRTGGLFDLPLQPTLEPWRQAWSAACTGVDCGGLRGGFWNSVRIAVPSTLLAVLLGAWNGYALSFWRPRGAEALFAVLLASAFLPGQVMLFPLVRMLAALQLFGSLPGVILVHVVFSMPVMTLLFRNFYRAVPLELFHAARLDGGGLARIFFQVMLPMSGPMLAVAALLQLTGVWNDYLLGLVFAGRENQPMTVALNNLVNTSTGERLYDVHMAATLLTSLVPLACFFVAGRWFVRGIAAGALKG